MNNNNKQMKICVSGNIGAGKSTLVKSLGTELDFKIYREPVLDNPYLGLFYQDMKTYAFPMQVFLFNHRYRQYLDILNSNKPSIQDRSVYEDQVFVNVLYEDGILLDLDYKTYKELVKNVLSNTEYPNIIIYLDVDPRECLKRIKNRGRKCEEGITLEYLIKLKKHYDLWIDNISNYTKVIRINWNTFKNTKDVIELLQLRC